MHAPKLSYKYLSIFLAVRRREYKRVHAPKLSYSSLSSIFLTVQIREYILYKRVHAPKLSHTSPSIFLTATLIKLAYFHYIVLKPSNFSNGMFKNLQKFMNKYIFWDDFDSGTMTVSTLETPTFGLILVSALSGCVLQGWMSTLLYTVPIYICFRTSN